MRRGGIMRAAGLRPLCQILINVLVRYIQYMSNHIATKAATAWMTSRTSGANKSLTPPTMMLPINRKSHICAIM